MIPVWLFAALAWQGPASDPTAPDPADYELRWQAPPECPDAASIAERVDRLLPGEGTGVGTMTVSASVSAESGGYRLWLATDFLGSHDTREVTADNCPELGETTALLIAMALEPMRAEALPAPSESVTFVESQAAIPPPPAPIEVVEARPRKEPAPEVRSPEPEPSEPPLSPQEPVPEEVRNRQPEPSEPPLSPQELSRRGMLVARIGLGGSIGALPRVGGASLIAIGVAGPSIRFEAHGVYEWPQVNEADAGTTSLQLGAVGARACARLWLKWVEFPTCGGIEAGALRADARGSTPTTLHGPWLAPLVSTGVSRRWRRVGFWASVTTLVRVLGTRILISGAPTSQPERVSARLLAGVSIFLP